MTEDELLRRIKRTDSFLTIGSKRCCSEKEVRIKEVVEEEKTKSLVRSSSRLIEETKRSNPTAFKIPCKILNKTKKKSSTEERKLVIEEEKVTVNPKFRLSTIKETYFSEDDKSNRNIKDYKTIAKKLDLPSNTKRNISSNPKLDSKDSLDEHYAPGTLFNQHGYDSQIIKRSGEYFEFEDECL
uniref:Uncharacterized protein n=1 Tax=Euplotes crassus TaxID=5936 RepID=A0A7S3KC96_EUPCR|mmetsp:Transcript_18420/g.18076  ORF Transcript_18420/g.18076 Transcript_18420/m.18076 type:complete len:184 (+) Transcript_18420:691-1242(+)